MAKGNVSQKKRTLVRCATFFALPPLIYLFGWGWITLIVSLAISVLASAALTFGKTTAISRYPFLWRLIAFYLVQLLICGIVHSAVSPAMDNKVKSYFVVAPGVNKDTNLRGDDKAQGELLGQAGKRPEDFAQSGGALPGGFMSQPKISVVLPCANEGEFMVKTAKSINEFTPAYALHEVVVVDDGSTPPLRTLLTDEQQKDLKITWVRHDHFTGLINAKSKGAAAATGDIIIFLDCHVKPAEGWDKPIVDFIRSNYKRVVVPSITDLDPDTWEEHRGGGGMSKCYLTWDADFKWFTSDDIYVPIMSGGLLAMSKKWWDETGGYDENMLGWGGENIDQSLRIWLCGGEIVNAKDSYVAHMWRLASRPKTRAKYTVPGGAVTTNRYRAAMAWYDEWLEKLETYPEFSQFAPGGLRYKDRPDISNILEVKERLKCKPFGWFLRRFKKVYFDGGLVPDKVFHLKDQSTNMCIERKGGSKVVLRPCSEQSPGQLWHGANRDTVTNKCCSSFRNWNTDQCLQVDSIGGQLDTGVCSTWGEFTSQWIKLDEASHQLQLAPGAWAKGRAGCIGGKRPKGTEVSLEDCEDPNFRQIFKVDEKTGGIVDVQNGECLTAASGKFELSPCDVDIDTGKVSGEQKFTLVDFDGKTRIEARDIGSNPLCADSASGTQLLLYSCYDSSYHNVNQAWQFSDRVNGGAIRFSGGSNAGKCFSVKNEAKTSQSVVLEGCISDNGITKYGQRFKKDLLGNGKFFTLRDGNWCLGAEEKTGLSVSQCDDEASSQQWEYTSYKGLVNQESGLCLDAGGGKSVQLYTCYSDGSNQNQVWEMNEAGFIRGGPDRTCLDFAPVSDAPLSAIQCSQAKNFKWSVYKPFEPLETTLYHQAEKNYPAVLASADVN
ncbi:hypothetical protein FOL47_008329 [Perkinsus chesapeaki]|uniref:Ricin B lectin domain-containing protein n=1 Tax=Perkinsus chesapeaki TaxID=330153 RepID=A0A7J6LEK8_PERCH|nr:hypothetical protein FOL47_008329 [Perkinsus chesapeaki]